jgi:hypothetical protein
MYETHLSADAREIGPSRIAPAFAGTPIASGGSNVVAVDIAGFPPAKPEIFVSTAETFTILIAPPVWRRV